MWAKSIEMGGDDMFCAMKSRGLGQRISRAAGLLVLIAGRAGAQVAVAPSPAAESDALYTMGVNLGQELSQNGVTAHVPMKRIEQGIQDGLAGKRIDGADQMRLNAFLQAASAAAAARNMEAASTFLARNAGAPGVVTTASGLQYKIVEAGDPGAASPKPTDMVTVDFKGRLLDGTVFDSSAKPGTASTVQANGVMKGWTEALPAMKPGATWQLFIPPDLGYGHTTRLGVPGGSLLIYELKLVRVSAPLVAPAGGAAGR
jgi:FKBP-type peptidyl-prolyl cis-trans isomerase FklB